MTTREPRERARWRVRWWGKWSRRALKGAGSLVALVLGLALIVVHNLDRPWVKRRVQAIVAKSAGVEIDYGAVRVSLFSGLDIDDIVVLSPPEVRRAAPELARIGHVAARWSLGSLAGDGPEITKLTVADVAVTVAMDEKGRTSFDAIPTTKPPEPSVPLSHRGASLLGSALPVGEIDITNVSATLVSTKEGNEVERTNLGGVELSASAEPAGQGGSLRLRLGSEGAPLELDLRRHGPRGDSIAHARFSATAVATSTDLALAIDLRVVDQTFAAGYGVAHVLHAGARARFDAPVGRTDVTLAAELADGAGHAEEAFASIPDEGAPILHHAVGEIDLARLLTAVPAELVPVTVTHAQVRYRVVEALLENPPRVSDRGTLAIDGDLSNLKLRLDGGGALSVDTAAVGLHVMPDSASAVVHGSAAFDGVTLASSRGDTKASAVDVRVDGRQSPGGALDGTVKLGFASVEASGSSPFAVRDGNLTVALGDLHVDADNPLATKGDVTITGEIAEISARSKSSRSVAGTVALRAHALLSGHAPYAVEVEAKTARLQLFDDKGRPLADAPARVAVAVTNAAPDLARPIASTGKAHLEAELGDARLDLDAGKEVDAVDYELHAHAATLEPTRPLLPADDTALIPLGRMALAIESKGRVERISSALPEIRHHTKLDIDRPGFGSIAARSLAVTVDSHGTAMRHDADIDVRAQALAIAGLGESDDHVTLSAKIDRAVPALRIELGTDGRATSKLAVAASFDRSRRAVSYEVSGELSHLASLQPLVAEVRGLDGLDLSKLEVGVAAKGELFGVVEDVTSDGATRMASNLALTAAATGTIDVRLAHASYGRGDVAVAVPQLTWHADLGLAGAQRKLQSHLDVASVHLAVGGHVLDAANISDQLSGIVTGDLHNPDAEVTEHVGLRTVRQDFAPMYNVGDVAFDLSARRDHEGITHLGGLRLTNGAGGTAFTLAGNLDLSGARRRLALHGKLDQDMAKVSNDAAVLTGRGRAALALRVESGDLVVFRTRTDVHLEGVDVNLPSAGVAVESADGDVPISLELRVAKDGVTMLRNTQVSPYSMLRFADQHPLLSQTSFLSIRSIKTPMLSIAPLAANLQIDRNIVALQQLEMGIRGGRVTGQCALDWDGEDSTLDMHVRATGVMSTHNEPFDGNGALQISARDRSVDGRAEILRIGKRHFLDLLDLVDPTRTDASMNRVRSALSLGYPDRVSLAFEHGFASAHVELGGLGSLLSIGDIRGIPMGPLLDRALKPLSRSKGRR